MSPTTTTTLSIVGHAHKLATIGGGGPGSYLHHLVKYGVVGGGGLIVIMLTMTSLLNRRQQKSDAINPGLYGVTGRMGGGKTYFMAAAAWAARKEGRPVFANFEVTGGTLVTSWREVLCVPDKSLVLLDEVHLWWPSANWNAPIEIMAWCSQLRKRGLTVLWTSQHWTFVSSRLKFLTFGVWECIRFKRGHQCTLFDGATYRPGRQAGKKDVREKMRRMYLVRKVDVMDSYDTEELVAPVIEWMNDTQGKPTSRNGENGAGRSVSGSEHTPAPLPSHWT